MKYRSRSNIVGLLLDEADGGGAIKIFNVSYPDSRWFFRRGKARVHNIRRKN
ncbi:MAG: hypothetical protein WA667_10715 [Candidatus Nitrosopolaris sp.]